MSHYHEPILREINRGRKECYKSTQNPVSFSITFRNLTERTVRLYWIDFNGRVIFYGYLKNSKAFGNKGLTIQTYVTHPWIAIDHAAGEFLHVNLQRVFRPISRQDFLEERRKADRIKVFLRYISIVVMCSLVYFIKCKNSWKFP